MSEKHPATMAQGAVTPIDTNVKLNQLIKALDGYRDVVAQVAPKNGIGVERIIAISGFIVKSNKKLAECEPASIISAVIMAAMTGLDPNPAAGQVYFVPYGGKVQLQYGYKGEVNLAYRTGVLESIYARAVYQGDTFHYKMGSNESIIHEPGANHGDPGMVVGAYCVAYLKGSLRPVMEYLNRTQIERLRKKNKSQSAGQYNPNGDPREAWATDYDMMARKSAMRRLIEKELPTSVEWQDAAMYDGAIAPSLDKYNRDGSGFSGIPENPEFTPAEVTNTGGAE